MFMGEYLAKLAESMFIAYNEADPNPWKTWDGKDVPQWKDLSKQVQIKWIAAAQSAWHITTGGHVATPPNDGHG